MAFTYGHGKHISSLSCLPANFIIIRGGLGIFYFDHLYRNCPSVSADMIGYMLSYYGSMGMFCFEEPDSIQQVCALLKQYLSMQTGYDGQSYLAFVNQ